MLNKLTDEQLALLDEVRSYWIDLAFSHKKIDAESLKPHYTWLYSLINKPAPLVICLKSPMELQIAANLFNSYKKQVHEQVGQQVWQQVHEQVWWQVQQQVHEQVGQQVWQQVWQQVSEQVWQQVWQQVDRQVWQQVGQQVGQQVHEQVGWKVQQQVHEQVWRQVWQQIHEQVWQQVRQQVYEQVHEQVGWQVQQQVYEQVGWKVQQQVHEQVWRQVWRQIHEQVGWQVGSVRLAFFGTWESQITSDSRWVSFYDYFQRLGFVQSNIFSQYVALLKSGVWMSILCEGVVFVCPGPVKAMRRKDGIVHNEVGPAYEFENGESYYVLNGVSVPKWLAETHADALKPEQILSIENADQKAEGIRKLGIERLVKYGKIIDTYKKYDQEWFTKSEYELVDMSPIFKALTYAPYLKMRNQSVPGVWHLEAVSKECKTVQDAVNFRTKSKSPNLQIIK